MKRRMLPRVLDVDGETVAMLLGIEERAKLVDEYISELSDEEKNAILAEVFDANHGTPLRDFYHWLERRTREDDSLGEMVSAAQPTIWRPETKPKNTDPD